MSLKDHKENFLSDPKSRLINPAKSNLGRVSKKILEGLTEKIKTKTGDNLWKSTQEVLSWFKSLENLKNARFLKFDIQEFYPSITEDLLDRALKYASSITEITEQDKEIVKLSKEALLFNSGKCWVKKSDTNFDVTMGSLDGAETAEIIGVYLLGKIKEIIPSKYLGLYRDDGLAVINNTNGQKLDKIRKELHKLFKNEGLKIVVENCHTTVDYLDVIMELKDLSFRPYRKPNDNPLYINSMSDHPPNIIKNIPTMIATRLSGISSDEKQLAMIKHDYERALEDSGYKHEINFVRPKPARKKRSRTRKVLWYNPPFSKSVSTNIGKKFFALMGKHFPPNHSLYPIVNKNKVKLSYSCMPNVGMILKSHNRSVLEQKSEESTPAERMCNCRDKKNCPLKGKCLVKSVVYQANVTTELGEVFTYIGLTENQFKQRYYGHCQSFRNSKYRLSTELSKLIWQLKEDKTQYNIDWKIITKSKSYSAGARCCNLCLEEKLQILKNQSAINKRTELISKCRHSRKFLISNCT